MTEPSLPAARTARSVSLFVTALWFWVLPGLASVLAVRHLFPDASDPFERASAEKIAKFAGDEPAALWAAFFLVFSLVARYWASSIPGVEAKASEAGPKKSASRRALSLAFAVAGAALVALFVRASIFQSNRVLSSSMLPSLTPGAELAVNKLAYGFWVPGTTRHLALPRRGDVIVFASPDASQPGELVKRVIGLPGDRVRVVGGRPVVNGWAPATCTVGRYPVVGADGLWTAEVVLEFLDDRSYVALYPVAGQVSPTFLDYVVKPGEVFVLGDNRPASLDSRAWNGGRGAGVPTGSISGRVERILASVDRNGHFDFSRVLEPLGLELNLPGIDARKLEENVQACLKLRPKDTYAPKPAQSKRPQ